MKNKLRGLKIILDKNSKDLNFKILKIKITKYYYKLHLRVKEVDKNDHISILEQLIVELGLNQ